MGYILKTSSITYKEDIIKEMSLEMGIPVKELEELVDLNLKYIKKSIIEKDYLLINLPNLCKLRLNYKLALDSVSGNSFQSPRILSLKRKITLLKSYKEKGGKIRLMCFKNPLYERLWRKFKLIRYNKNTYKKMESMIKELEEETNIIIEKIK